MCEAFIDDLVAIGEQAEPDIGELTRAELGDMWARCDQYIALLTSARGKIADELAAILDTPLVLDNGTVLKAERQVTRRGWAKAALTTKLVEWCSRRLVDQETGEVVTALDPEKVKQAFEPATGRTGFLKNNVGIALDDYCEETWGPKLVVIR